MKRKKGLLKLVVVLVVFFVTAFLLYGLLGEDKPDLTGQGESQGRVSEENIFEEESVSAAPDFAVVDASGNDVRLSDLTGKPVVLNFWATWCGPCQREMPVFDAMHEKYGEQVGFMMVDLTDGYQETMGEAQRYIDEAGYSFPVYFDINAEGAIAYGVSSVPVTYFIDADGNMVSYSYGVMDEATLEESIGQLL